MKSIEELLVCHPSYNPLVAMPNGNRNTIQNKFDELYEGGERFEGVKDQYLRRRQADANPAYRQARVAAAHHPELASSLIDLLAGSTFSKNPKIKTEDDAPAYWSNLSKDSDGTGKDLSAVLYFVILQVLIHRRAYLAVDFPAGEKPASLAIAKDGGKWMGRAPLDAYIIGLGAKDIDDWGEDQIGNLTWCRIHAVEYPRTDYGVATVERHTWSYITPNDRTDYAAEKKIDEPWAKDQPANFVGRVEFNYGGRLPIARVEVPKGLWAMNRLSPRLIGIFNAEASLSFLHDSTCLQMPVITSDRDIKNLWFSELNALKLLQGESASFLAPSSVPYAELRASIDKDEEKLYRSLHSMAQLAAAKDGYGRQSGNAVTAKETAINTIMAVYRGLLLDALTKCVDLIKNVRDENELAITIDGLETQEEEDAEEKEHTEINGAVAQGMVGLITAGIITREEARVRMGFEEINENLPARINAEAVPKNQGELNNV